LSIFILLNLLFLLLQKLCAAIGHDFQLNSPLGAGHCTVPGRQRTECVLACTGFALACHARVVGIVDARIVNKSADRT
jgi:hypothetical protein